MDIIIKIIIAGFLWYLSYLLSSYIYKMVKIDRVFFGYICGAAFVLALLIPLIIFLGEIALDRYFMLFYALVALGGYGGYVKNFEENEVQD